MTSSRVRRRPELLQLLALLSKGSQRRRRTLVAASTSFCSWAALRRRWRRALRYGRDRSVAGLLATRGEEVKMGYHNLVLDTIV